MLEKHSITIKGHQTSITLEKEFWEELKLISHNENKSIGKIISEIDNINPNQNLSSSIRIFVLKKLKSLL